MKAALASSTKDSSTIPSGIGRTCSPTAANATTRRTSIPIPSRLLAALESGRKEALAAIAGLSDAQLDSPVVNERLAIKDLQSQIEFMVWHDAHHDAQLGAILNNHKASQSG